MKDTVGYFLLTNVLVFAACGIRAAYLATKFVCYLEARYPEKAKEFGCYSYNRLKLVRALYQNHQIDDTEFRRLKTKARNAVTWCILALLPMSLFMIVIFVIGLLFG